MHDRIEIRNLRARTIIGVREWERKAKQDVVVNIEMFTDTRKAGKSDDLKDSVDYQEVTQAVLKLVESAEFQLVEKLAEEIAKICVKTFCVQRAIIHVDKPGAVRFTESVGVRIERVAEDYVG